jgi:hypothetical protein
MGLRAIYKNLLRILVILNPNTLPPLEFPPNQSNVLPVISEYVLPKEAEVCQTENDPPL